MGPQYVNQKVSDSLEEQLIGEYSPANFHRLKMATQILTAGVIPLNRNLLSNETASYLERLIQHVGGDTKEDFNISRENYIEYLISSVRDEAFRSVKAQHRVS